MWHTVGKYFHSLGTERLFWGVSQLLSIYFLKEFTHDVIMDVISEAQRGFEDKDPKSAQSMNPNTCKWEIFR